MEVEPCAQDKTLPPLLHSLPPPLHRASLPLSLLMMGGAGAEQRVRQPRLGSLWPPSQTANCIPHGEQGPIPASEAIRFLDQPVLDFPPG